MSTVSLLVIIAAMIEYPLLSSQELYEVKFCPLRGKPQGGIKYARDLLGEMLMRCIFMPSEMLFPFYE